MILDLLVGVVIFCAGGLFGCYREWRAHRHYCQCPECKEWRTARRAMGRARE